MDWDLVFGGHSLSPILSISVKYLAGISSKLHASRNIATILQCLRLLPQFLHHLAYGPQTTADHSPSQSVTSPAHSQSHNGNLPPPRCLPLRANPSNPRPLPRSTALVSCFQNVDIYTSALVIVAEEQRPHLQLLALPPPRNRHPVSRLLQRWTNRLH